MKIIQGDIIAAFKAGEIHVLVHQVNCQRVMGAGLAKQIKQAFPQHYTDYMQTTPRLGGSVITCLPDGDIYVVGIYGQDRYGKGLHTNYQALADGLDKLVGGISPANIQRTRIGIPYKLGCGLAGGDWGVVQDIIESVEQRYNTEFSIYKLGS